jgi:hypothetical protein
MDLAVFNFSEKITHFAFYHYTLSAFYSISVFDTTKIKIQGLLNDVRHLIIIYSLTPLRHPDIMK